MAAVKRSPKTYAKALVAAAVAAVTAAIPYSSDGINLQEALIILGAALVAGQATYWTPNKDDGAHADESVQTDGLPKPFGVQQP